MQRGGTGDEIMGNKTLDSVMNRIDAMKNRGSQVTAAGKKKEMEEYRNSRTALRRNYDAVSKYGDTLEISEGGKKIGEHSNKEPVSLTAKKIISDEGELT